MGSYKCPTSKYTFESRLWTQYNMPSIMRCYNNGWFCICRQYGPYPTNTQFPDPILRNNSDTCQKLKTKAQKMAVMWDGLIRATGEPYKQRNLFGIP